MVSAAPDFCRPLKNFIDGFVHSLDASPVLLFVVSGRSSGQSNSWTSRCSPWKISMIQVGSSGLIARRKSPRRKFPERRNSERRSVGFTAVVTSFNYWNVLDCDFLTFRFFLVPEERIRHQRQRFIIQIAGVDDILVRAGSHLRIEEPPLLCFSASCSSIPVVDKQETRRS